MEEQLLVGLISLGGMIIMIVATAGYLFFAFAESNVFKAIIIINAICGIGFLGSTFIGMLQQYKIAKVAGGLTDLINLGVKGGKTNGKEKI